MPRVFLSNACCLTNKMDELEYVLQSNKIDIAVVTESWFSLETEGSSQMDNYKVYNKSRTLQECGGISVFVKDDIPCTVIQEDTSDLEVLWL